MYSEDICNETPVVCANSLTGDVSLQHVPATFMCVHVILSLLHFPSYVSTFIDS